MPTALRPLIFAAAILTLMLLLLAGCETTDPAADAADPLPPEPERPTVSELLKRYGPQVDLPAPEPPVQPQAAYAVERLVMPLNQSLEWAWSYVDQAVVPERSRTLLNRNGIRIGVLPLAELNDFEKAVANRMVTTHYRTAGSMRLEQLVRRPMGDRQAIVELTLPPDVPQTYIARGGAVQMLHQAVRGPQGGVSLRLLPHHHLIQPSIQPRSPLDTEFDGRLFHELMVTLNPTPKQLIVIGLYWPWQEFKPLQPGDPGFVPQRPQPLEDPDKPDAPAMQPAPSSETPTPETPGGSKAKEENKTPGLDPQHNVVYQQPDHLPPSLGAALFTGQQVGKPAQLLFVIRVTPVGPQPSAER